MKLKHNAYKLCTNIVVPHNLSHTHSSLDHTHSLSQNMRPIHINHHVLQSPASHRKHTLARSNQLSMELREDGLLPESLHLYLLHSGPSKLK